MFPRHPAKPRCFVPQMNLRDSYRKIIFESYLRHGRFVMEVKETKINRSLRLDPELDEQLVLVCKTLGVNPNAYLRQVVGEAINKHMAQYRIERALVETVTNELRVAMVAMANKEGVDIKPEDLDIH